MHHRMIRAAVAVAAFASASAACDTSATCTYTVPYQGTNYVYNLVSLCNFQQDYVATNAALGHTFYAQICGTTTYGCLPAS